ncbi:hypothetical protein GIB67_027890 [Kingdonia uniflora]|uniref:Methyltransferase type 11 domain-containing protein n=1 Tax=Kingdonia uniflora TaxID=39325 RepID=A0A7J7LGK0_9MAGN|nr:hypothetical protein GIB67_027890 [Kingdonia uniflora]
MASTTKIANMYNDLAWEEIWGDHIHQGFYDLNTTTKPDRKTAQFRLIEEALRFGNVSEDSVKKPKSIVDVGCGIGGPAIYLAKKYGAKCIGIDITPYNVQRGREISNAQGLGDKVTFQVGDALQLPFPNGKFDLVWSSECGIHLPDKTKFVSELVRIAAPGATIILIDSCHRDLANEESLKLDEEEFFLKNKSLLPEWVSCAQYVNMFKSNLIKDIKSVDWSEHVAPFWEGRIWETINGEGDLEEYNEGRKKGIVRFSVITCQKPE